MRRKSRRQKILIELILNSLIRDIAQEVQEPKKGGLHIMQIITAAIIKGGAGKSTTIAALAQAANAKGKRVLVIDLDPQMNVSFFMGADTDAQGTKELLHGTPAREVIQHTEQGIDIIAASEELATEMTNAASAKRLEDAIEPLKRKYDYIFIDTPPQMGELTFNGLQASTGIIVPMEADNSNLQGLYKLVDILQDMPKSKVIGTIITRYDARPKINQYMHDEIAEKGREEGAPLIADIRPGIAIREAQAQGVSLYDYAPKSKPAIDYMALFELIDNRRAKK